MQNTIVTILIAAIAGALGGAFAVHKLSVQTTPTEENLIADFYALETAVLISPHGLRMKMDKGHDDFILVDVRSAEEYEEEHIVGAINIPAYTDKSTSKNTDRDRIIEQFEELGTEKDIIIYCYSAPCMTGKKIGNLLAKNGIYAKELGVGWNEWRYDWEGWNLPHEWESSSPEEYIVRGTEPGTPTVRAEREACPVGGDLGC